MLRRRRQPPHKYGSPEDRTHVWVPYDSGVEVSDGTR